MSQGRNGKGVVCVKGRSQEYPFELSKPLPFIEVQGRQVVPVDYFINNDLEYLKGGSSSRKYTTFTTKTKAAKEDQKLYKFKEGDFPRLNLCDIKDMLLLLAQNKLSNIERDFIFDLNVALRMFTRRVVILKRMEDLQLGVESYQKKLNITKPETFRRNNLDKQRSRIMIKAIDKLQLERRLMRSLEKFVGGRDYEEDFRLLEWTI
nr:hypothetical protein [Tanacetum cinerariifolium]